MIRINRHQAEALVEILGGVLGGDRAIVSPLASGDDLMVITEVERWQVNATGELRPMGKGAKLEPKETK